MTIKCSAKNCKYKCGTPANLVFHYQTFHKDKICKCVCGNKSINGVCVVEDCNSNSRLKDIIDANPSLNNNIDLFVDESNSFTDPRSGNSVDGTKSFGDPRSGNPIHPVIDPIINPLINLDSAALVALSQPNKKEIKKMLRDLKEDIKKELKEEIKKELTQELRDGF